LAEGLPAIDNVNYKTHDLIQDFPLSISLDTNLLDTQEIDIELSHQAFDSELDQFFIMLNQTATIDEYNETRDQPASEAWAQLLVEPPEVMLEEFVSSLNSFVEKIVNFDISSSSLTDEYGENDYAETNLSTINTYVLPLFQLVAERIISSEDNEKVAEHVQNIVGAIHGIKLLQERGAEPSQVTFATIQLLEYTTKLFEELGISHEEAAKLFAWALLRPEYSPLELQRESLMQEGLGTHELKTRSQQYVDPAHIKFSEHRVLGKLIIQIIK
jgi:hypothetical protein